MTHFIHMRVGTVSYPGERDGTPPNKHFLIITRWRKYMQSPSAFLLQFEIDTLL